MKLGHLSPLVQRWVQFTLIALVALALAACGSDDTPATDSNTQAPVTDSRPNILLIVADDLGYSDIGAFGGEIETSNLDRLVAEGRLLASHYVGATCSPTRSMLMADLCHA